MKNTILVGFISVILVSCSSPEKTVKQKDAVELEEMEFQEVRLQIEALNSWINLMPGSESRFHISGEIIIEENYKYNLKFMEIDKIDISQNNALIYSIKPLVQVDMEQSTGTEKYLRFSTVKGLSRDPRLDIDKPVNFNISFNDGNETYEYVIDNVEIRKVY